METIKEHITQLNSILFRIRLILVNKYNANCQESSQELYDLDIPTVSDDKANRKNDFKAVGSDMKKGLKEKQESLEMIEK